MSLSKLLQMREINLLNKQSSHRQQVMTAVMESRSLSCNCVHEFNSHINYMDIDSTENKFLLSGFTDGSVSLHEITDENRGQLTKLSHNRYLSAINRCQWYPIDTGMFSITCSDCVAIIDTNNSIKPIDCYRFSNTKIYWTDWNQNTPTTIAVACSSSAVRIIDIRSGNSVQQITTNSMTATSKHHITRIAWTPLDSDCLIAGDSQGFLHLYDIRRPKLAVRVVGNDYTSFEPITCLTFSRDKMSVFTCHGISNKLNLWHFMCNDLKNSDINFECPIVKSKKKKQNMNSSYLRCEIYVTNNFVFTPAEERPFGKDIIIYDISTGMRAFSLMPSDDGMFSANGPNCVTGVDNGVLVIFSGGFKRLCTWTPNIVYDDKESQLQKYYFDKWSDDSE